MDVTQGSLIDLFQRLLKAKFTGNHAIPHNGSFNPWYFFLAVLIYLMFISLPQSSSAHPPFRYSANDGVIPCEFQEGDLAGQRILIVGAYRKGGLWDGVSLPDPHAAYDWDRNYHGRYFINQMGVRAAQCYMRGSAQVALFPVNTYPLLFLILEKARQMDRTYDRVVFISHGNTSGINFCHNRGAVAPNEAGLIAPPAALISNVEFRPWYDPQTGSYHPVIQDVYFTAANSTDSPLWDSFVSLRDCEDASRANLGTALGAADSFPEEGGGFTVSNLEHFHYFGLLLQSVLRHEGFIYLNACDAATPPARRVWEREFDTRRGVVVTNYGEALSVTTGRAVIGRGVKTGTEPNLEILFYIEQQLLHHPFEDLLEPGFLPRDTFLFTPLSQ